MRQIKRFEDIQVWQDARVFANAIYDASDGQLFNKDFALRDQLRRAVISIMSNIAEGFDRFSPKEFILFQNYAKASAAEVRAQFYLALDRKYLSESQFTSLHKDAISLSKQLAGFIKYLKMHKRS